MLKVKTKKDLLALVLPTNNIRIFHQCFLRTIDWIDAIKPYATICINFQSPWSEESIDDVLGVLIEKNWKVEWTLNKYDCSVNIPMNKIREDAACLCPEAFAYWVLDDDHTFAGPSTKINKTFGEQILCCLHYMLNNEKCGVITTGGSLFKAIEKNHIGWLYFNDYFITNYGFMVRNLKDVNGTRLLPKDSLDLVGSDEERVICAERINNGFYNAKIAFARCRRGSKINNEPDGTTKYHWNTSDILDNNNSKYIREHYNPNYVKQEGRSSPYSYFEYINHDGIPEDQLPGLTVDYTEYTKEDLINSINELVCVE